MQISVVKTALQLEREAVLRVQGWLGRAYRGCEGQRKPGFQVSELEKRIRGWFRKLSPHWAGPRVAGE